MTMGASEWRGAVCGRVEQVCGGSAAAKEWCGGAMVLMQRQRQNPQSMYDSLTFFPSAPPLSSGKISFKATGFPVCVGHEHRVRLAA